MSASYSPTAEFTDSTTVLADGDAASATNLNAAPKKALDRAAYLRAATDGLLVWQDRARVATGGTNNGNFAVYCPPIEAVSVLNGTTWVALSLASETQLTSALHFGSGTLAADTFYAVYAYYSGGSLGLDVSVTMPGTDGVWKSGAVGTHRFLFVFHTGSSGVPLPMQMAHGRYRYRVSAITSTELRALNATAVAGSPTDVILARAGVAGRELVPSMCRIAHLRAVCISSGNSASDQVTGLVYTNGDTTTPTARFVMYPQIASQEMRMDFDIECDSARTVDYTLAVGNADASDPTVGSFDLYVVGFDI